MGLGGEALEVLLSQKKTGHWIFLSSLTRQKAEEPRGFRWPPTRRLEWTRKFTSPLDSWHPAPRGSFWRYECTLQSGSTSARLADCLRIQRCRASTKSVATHRCHRLARQSPSTGVPHDLFGPVLNLVSVFSLRFRRGKSKSQWTLRCSWNNQDVDSVEMCLILYLV